MPEMVRSESEKSTRGSSKRDAAFFPAGPEHLRDLRHLRRQPEGHELASILARAYVRLVARGRSCGDCSTNPAQKPLDVPRPESPPVVDETRHGRPRWKRA